MTRSVRLVVAALVVAAAGLTLPAPTAYAAACSGDSGVTVVVDFNGLGGGVQQACVTGGGGDSAASLFQATGHQLSYATRMPGFVCRVDGVPASDPCVNTSPANAYWSLWWSDGDASSWTYASVSAGALKIPDGGMVAFSWDGVDGQAPPSASASHPDPPAPPSPTQPPPDQGGGDNSGGDHQGPGFGSSPDVESSVSPGASPSVSPSASDEVERGKGGMDQERHPRKDRSDDPSGGASPTLPSVEPPTAGPSDGGSLADPASDSGGLPGWVAPVLIAVLFAAAGVVLLLRRRRSET